MTTLDDRLAQIGADLDVGRMPSATEVEQAGRRRRRRRIETTGLALALAGASVLGASVLSGGSGEVTVRTAQEGTRQIEGAVEVAELPVAGGTVCSRDDLCVSAEGVAPDQRLTLYFRGQRLRTVVENACTAAWTQYAGLAVHERTSEGRQLVSGTAPRGTPPLQFDGVDVHQFTVVTLSFPIQFFVALAPDEESGRQIVEELFRYSPPSGGAVDSCDRSAASP